MIAAATAALLLSTACSTPPTAVVRQCDSSLKAAECTVTVEQLDKLATTTFNSQSSNRGVAVQATITVETGQAVVRVIGSQGVAAETTVMAGQPAEINARTIMKMGRKTGEKKDEGNSFRMEFDPQQPTTKLSASINYQVISQAEATS